MSDYLLDKVYDRAQDMPAPGRLVAAREMLKIIQFAYSNVRARTTIRYEAQNLKWSV